MGRQARSPSVPPRQRRLACLVVGDAAVTVRCAEAIHGSGHEVLGMVTADQRCAAWAAAAEVPIHVCAPDGALDRHDLEVLVADRRVDLLLSIHNLRILRPEVLALARLAAVNYHDALLPARAGLHATTWAIAQGATCHGVTWHRMTAEVDAGAILAQRTLAVGADETAWTLGSRCTDAAVEALVELLPGLADGSVSGRPQPRRGRSYFSRWMTPTAGCVVPVDEPAEVVSALVRALDYGPADNPVGIPTLLTPIGPVLVASVDILEDAEPAPPGRVLEAGGDHLVVGTATHPVRLTLRKDALPAGGRSMGVLHGSTLTGELADPAWLESFQRRHKRFETVWAQRYQRLRPLAPPGLSDEDGGAEALIEVDLPLADRERHDPDAPLDGTLAAVLRWLADQIGEPFDVGFSEPDLTAEIIDHGAEPFLTLRPPLRVEWPLPATLEGVTAWCRRERGRRRREGTCTRDLPHRLRRLSRRRVLEPGVVIDVMDAPSSSRPRATLGPETRLLVEVGPSPGRVCLRTRNGSRETLRELARGCRQSVRRAARQQEPAGPPCVTDVDARAADDVLALFDRVVARNGDGTAILGPDRGWTFAALDRRSRRLAAMLARRAVGPESVVIVRVTAVADLVTAMLAVLRAGAAFCVIDPAEPVERVRRMVDAAQPDLALGDPRLAAVAPDLPTVPPRMWEAEEHPEVEMPPVDPTWLAYVAFTSGSTGQPKGVAVQRGSLGSYIAAAGARFDLGPADRILQIGSPAFDLAYEQIFGALGHAATLVESDQGAYAGTADLLERSSAAGVTVLDLPTAVWSRMVNDLTDRALELPDTLRLVIIGGEAAAAEEVRSWCRRVRDRGVRLVNTYGPTETTIVATWWEAPTDAAAVPDPVPIGRPVPGVETLVLNRVGAAVPDGAEGELWIGGDGLARGYHRHPDLTAQAFRTVAGRRLYRTGDRVRRDGDGQLRYLGRFDRQLKIAGRRVDPAEVEAALRSCDGVLEAAVAPLGDGRRTLGAWVVVRERGETEKLRRRVAELLPPFLRPARIEAVPHHLPRTAAGAVDLEALTRGLESSPGLDPALDDPLERDLASIWDRLLRCGPVGPDDDFFELGGESLAAVRLLEEIDATFGVRLPVARLGRDVTVRALARDLRDAPGEVTSCVVNLQPEGSGVPLLCVHGLGGHLLRLTSLARELAPDQPFLGLQSPGLDNGQAVPATVERLAAVYLREAVRVGGDQPLLLSGMSFGGVVALEMARQAEAQGRRVGLVAMFDTCLREVLDGPPRLHGWSLVRERVRRAAGDRLGAARRRLRRLARGCDQIVQANEYRNFGRVLRINQEALRRYRLPVYRGPVTFFATSQRGVPALAELERRTGCRLEVVPLPGNHLGMYEPPHVRTLAEAIRAAIRGAVAADGRGT